MMRFPLGATLGKLGRSRTEIENTPVVGSTHRKMSVGVVRFRRQKNIDEALIDVIPRLPIQIAIKIVQTVVGIRKFQPVLSDVVEMLL